MSNQDISIRLASPKDGDTVAEIARLSRKRFLPYLPDLHSYEEDKGYFRNVVFAECDVWIAEDSGVPIGFIAFKEDWVDHLYLLPGYVGAKTGETLLAKAKQAHRFLQLWVFQKNVRAISFYERNGFRLTETTNGAASEEKLPDALYQWRAP